jgi:hypothetical protein
MKNKNNNRKTSRVKYKQPVTLKRSGIRVKGWIQNISLKGLFIKTDKASKCCVGDKLDYEIILPGSKPKILIKGKAIIARKESSGYGIYFLSMSSHDLSHLRRLVELNLDQSEGLTKEFKSFIK